MLFLVMLSVTTAISGQQSASDSTCSEYTIPFSFQSDQAGNPTLSCTSPACFGEKKVHELERGDVIPESETKNSFGLRNLIHKAQCQRFYQNSSCSGGTQWTIDILLEGDGNSLRAKWKCCHYNGLRHANTVKTVVLNAGDRYTGGEVYQNGRKVAFDLIKEIQLSYDEHYRPRYELKIMRLSCIPKPADTKNEFQSDKNGDSNLPAKGISSEYDVEEYVSTNLHRTTSSKPRRRSTVLEEDFDDLLPPRHRMARRRMLALHRRPFYRPIIEDYDYYDYDPVLFRRPSAHRRLAASDQLWPINFGIVGRSRPVVAAGVASPTLYEISSPNAVEGDYHQLIDGDSAAVPVTSVPAEAYNNPPLATVGSIINDFSASRSQPAQIEVQPASGQPLSSYSGVQYPPQTVIVQPEPKIVPVAQQTVPLYSGTVPYYNGYFETLQCFSGDTTVQTPDRVKRIDELQVGDQVLSIEESLVSYSPVVMFLHRSHNESAIFNKIILENGKILKLTDYHLLYVTDCMAGEELRLIYAKDVRLRQCLHAVRKESNNLVPIQVSNIQRVTGKGLYAPLTATGDIVVSSVLSSCHCNIAAQTLQQSLFTLLKLFHSLLPTDSITGLLPGIRYLIQISHIFLPRSFV